VTATVGMSRKLTKKEKRQLALGDWTAPETLREDPYAAPFDYAGEEGAPETAPTGEEMERELRDPELATFYDANHRFSVSKLDRRRWKLPALLARYCFVCGKPTPPSVQFDCEFPDDPCPPNIGGCAGCRANKLAERQELRGAGRPKLTCGNECQRVYQNARKALAAKNKRREARGLPSLPELGRATPLWTRRDQDRIEDMAFRFERKPSPAKRSHYEWALTARGNRRRPAALPGTPPERLPS
jgi:hypothetical protein